MVRRSQRKSKQWAGRSGRPAPELAAQWRQLSFFRKLVVLTLVFVLIALPLVIYSLLRPRPLIAPGSPGAPAGAPSTNQAVPDRVDDDPASASTPLDEPSPNQADQL